MGKKLFVRTLTALLSLLSVLTITGPAIAAGPSFQVRPVYPENQLTKNGYFDIRMTPGQEQLLTLLVDNDEERAIQVAVELVNASTAPDGFIDYTTPGVRDESMDYPFTELATLPQELVEVPAGGRSEITIRVRAPEESFDGMILGGVRVLKLNEEPGQGMITNAYQYALAVAITQNDRPVQPDFELAGVATGLENYRAAVTASLRNTQATPAKGVDARVELLQDGIAQPVYTLEKQVDVAPNSVWNCVLQDRAGYGFGAGGYLLRARLEWEGEVWEFEHAFTITGADADYMSNNAVNQQQGGRTTSLWIYLLVCLGLLLLLVLIVLVILLLRKKRES